MKSPRSTFVSILFPVYNEKTTIQRNIVPIEAVFESILGPNRFELILIDNGSEDGTGTLFEYLKENAPRTRMIVSRKKGRGAALKAGYDAARGEFIAVMSIDRAWDETFVARGLEHLVSGADIVFGQKSHPESRVSRPWVRQVGSVLIRSVVSVLFFIPPQDTQCVKVFRTDRVPFLKSLRDYNYFAECEFFLWARYSKLEVRTVPVTVADHRGDSKVRLASAWQYLLEAVHFRLSLLKRSLGRVRGSAASASLPR